MRKRKTFGQLLFEYRRQRDMTQTQLAEKVGLHPSDISKIEVGTRKPPKIELIHKIIQALDLTNQEIEMLIGASGYTSDLFNLPRFDFTQYPTTTVGQVESWLTGISGPSPTLFVNLAHEIVAANLLAFLVFGRLPEDPSSFDSKQLLGKTIYEIFFAEDVFKRLLLTTAENDFFLKMIFMFMTVEKQLPAAAVKAFQNSSKHHQQISLLYEHGALQPKKSFERVSFLTIKFENGILELDVEIAQVSGEKLQGLLVIFHLYKVRTREFFETTWKKLAAAYQTIAFLQELSENESQ